MIQEQIGAFLVQTSHPYWRSHYLIKIKLIFKVLEGVVEGFLEKVLVRIGGIEYEIEVVFAEISDFGHGILGHRGFFDHFDVSLKYKVQIIEIKENS